MTSGIFDLSAATQLAHALAAGVARAQGVRVLSIKGPIAEHFALRAPRISADADILVEPAHFSEFGERLERLGWHTRVGRQTPSLLPQHSITYIHPDWPCDIDVHWMFPGFFADPQIVFDALWASRSEVTIAHRPVWAPSKAGTAVVMALHAARDLRARRHAEEDRLVRSALIESFSECERREFADITREGGGGWVLRDLLTEAGLGPVDDEVDDEQRRLWDLFSGNVDDASSVAWWHQVGAVRWWRKPWWILRALWVSRRDIPRNDPNLIPTHWEFWAYQVNRWGRGWRATLRYIREPR